MIDFIQIWDIVAATAFVSIVKNFMSHSLYHFLLVIYISMYIYIYVYIYIYTHTYMAFLNLILKQTLISCTI